MKEYVLISKHKLESLEKQSDMLTALMNNDVQYWESYQKSLTDFEEIQSSFKPIYKLTEINFTNSLIFSEPEWENIKK